MKIFFCGDFQKINGPGIANRSMKNGFESIRMPNDIFYYTRASKKAGRIAELFHVIGSEWILLCSASQFNRLVILIAHILHIKVAYMIHGLSSYEKELNEGKQVNTKKQIQYEKFIFKNVDIIFAVSKVFCEVLQTRYPKDKKKITYCFNSISENISSVEPLSHDSITRVISVGGAMPQKNMLPVCEAIERINKKRSQPIDFYIIGKSKIEIDQISQYSCVKYIETMEHKELMKMFHAGGIYIQNSVFETFGLTIVEALSQGCDILISKYVGVIDLFGNLNDTDVIYNPMNVDEIEKKIEYILGHGNRKRLCECFDWNKVKPEYQAQNILDRLREEIV